ncbi:hypothetical protein K7711_32395 [Nocardia sp. CA2R105]|uniref:hypothetical protein n=1 Tax=Nocardia coffeae TaxID=2873381 RepID=UPI001CA74002|nr:hypothetical protein [Nocardia coffeae]MBY8861216.1 hypothetical protein [Nocardia coffeae]
MTVADGKSLELTATQGHGAPSVVAILALRADFYGEAAVYPELLASLAESSTADHADDSQ